MSEVLLYIYTLSNTTYVSNWAVVLCHEGLSEVLESSSLPSLPPSLDRLLPATETIVGEQQVSQPLYIYSTFNSQFERHPEFYSIGYRGYF